jgi:signal peptidase I
LVAVAAIAVGLRRALGLPRAIGLRRVQVLGPSMEPTLLAGDRLVVLILPTWWPIRSGQLVALQDPRPGANRILVKRVQSVIGRAVEFRGDNPLASTDSRTLGPVDRRQVVGRPLYRYSPPDRSGRLPGSDGPPTSGNAPTPTAAMYAPRGGDRGR